MKTTDRGDGIRDLLLLDGVPEKNFDSGSHVGRVASLTCWRIDCICCASFKLDICFLHISFLGFTLRKA
jgi:hypothetical protein